VKRNHHIIALIKKDLLLEIRQQHTFYGLLLYMASTIFVLYLSVEIPDMNVWNGLFWMTQLFLCVNAVAKSFLQEGKGRMLYYFTIASPQQYILSKLFFNVLLMTGLSLLSLLLFRILLETPIAHPWTFIGIVCMGGCSLSLVFTFLAAIAARAQQNAAVMAILGFPLIIPQLMLLLRLSPSAFFDVLQTGTLFTLLLLLGFDLMVIALSYILFPFLWKD
jgi:heme exporter protein B